MTEWTHLYGGKKPGRQNTARKRRESTFFDKDRTWAKNRNSDDFHSTAAGRKDVKLILYNDFNLVLL